MATASLSLVVIPVVVARLGVAGYGTWEAIIACATLAAMFQGALTGTMVWRTSQAFGARDFEEIRRVVRVGVGATLALGGVLWPAGWVLRHGVVGLLRVPDALRADASMVFPVVVGLMLLGGLPETLEAVVNGCQRSGLVTLIGAGALLVNYCVVITAMLFGLGLWSLALGQGVGLLARLAGAYVAARRLAGAVTLVPGLPRRADLSSARYSGLMTVGFVSAALRDQTDKLVLSSLASTTWVGYYSIAARLANLVIEVVRFFYMPMLTAVGALHAISDWAGIRQLYSQMMAVVSGLAGAVIVVVAGLSGPLVVLWMGRPIPEVTPMLLLLLTGTASAVILTGPGTALCRGVGRVGIETTYVVVNLVANFVLTVILVLTVGPIGTVIASGSTWAVCAVLFAVVLHRRLPLPVEATRRAGYTALLAAALAFAVSMISARAGVPATREAALGTLLLYGSTVVLVYSAVAFGLRLLPRPRIRALTTTILRRGHRDWQDR